ncbi:MAG: extracellular solute-binding protein [Candidatus Methylacidiphilales bacterium]
MHSPEPISSSDVADKILKWIRLHPVLCGCIAAGIALYLIVVTVFFLMPGKTSIKPVRVSAGDAGTSAASPTDVTGNAPPITARGGGPMVDLAPGGSGPEPSGTVPDMAAARAAGVQTLTLGGAGAQDEPLPSGTKHLRVWYGGSYINRATVERRLTEFAKSNGLGIEVTFVPEMAGYPDRLEQALGVAATHQFAPDVFLLDAGQAERLVQSGYLAALTVPDIGTANWLPWTLAPLTRGAHMVAYPCDFSALVLYYNRGLFDRGGQAAPDMHWNWEIWVSLCSGLQKRLAAEAVSSGQATKDQSPLIVGVEFPLRADYLSALAAQADGPLFRNGKWLLGSQECREGQRQALTMMQVLMDEKFAYYVAADSSGGASGKGTGAAGTSPGSHTSIMETGTRPATAPTKGPQAPAHVPGTRFLAGQAATLVAGTEMLPVLRNQRTLRWGICLLPRFTTATTTLEVRGWAVNSRAPLSKEAESLALWMSSTAAGEERLSARAGGPEVRGPETPLFDAAASTAQPLPILKDWPIYQQALNARLAALPADGAWEENDALAALAKATGVEMPLPPVVPGFTPPGAGSPGTALTSPDQLFPQTPVFPSPLPAPAPVPPKATRP